MNYFFQCLSDAAFADEVDDCIRNPKDCPDGFSFSIFYMPDYSELDSQLANPSGDFDLEYILSTGGEVDTPGVAIYREGGKLGVLVSTGTENWVVEVVGNIPMRDKWTNIGIRWRPLNFETKEEFDERIKGGQKQEDFGGLTVFMDLR